MNLRLGSIFAFVVLSAALTLVLAGCGGGAASANKVAGAAGATSCDNSGFYIQSKLTNEKDVVYDCRFATGLPKCVTYSGNVANNATEEVQLLFANSLNARRPACLGWVATAKAHLARIAAQKAAARQAARLAQKRRTYRSTLFVDRKSGWHNGYTAWNGNPLTYQVPTIYYKFLAPSTYSCPQYGDGCFKIEVVTRNGCSDLSLELGEYASQGGPKLGTTYGDGGAVYHFAPVVIELDDDTSGIHWGQIDSINCY